MVQCRDTWDRDFHNVIYDGRKEVDVHIGTSQGIPGVMLHVIGQSRRKYVQIFGFQAIVMTLGIIVYNLTCVYIIDT